MPTGPQGPFPTTDDDGNFAWLNGKTRVLWNTPIEVQEGVDCPGCWDVVVEGWMFIEWWWSNTSYIDPSPASPPGTSITAIQHEGQHVNDALNAWDGYYGEVAAAEVQCVSRAKAECFKSLGDATVQKWKAQDRIWYLEYHIEHGDDRSAVPRETTELGTEQGRFTAAQNAINLLSAFCPGM